MAQLTDQQLKALSHWLQTRDRKTIVRGTDLYRNGHVLSEVIIVKQDAAVVTAEVLGSVGDHYEVELLCSKKGWDGLCSCPMDLDCKHCVAVAQKLLFSRPPAGKIVNFATSGPTQKSAKSKPAPRKAFEMIGGFAFEFAARLHRDLSIAEQHIAIAINQIHDELSRFHRVENHHLERITGQRTSWGIIPGSDVGPSRSANAWVTWLFLAAYLRANNKPITSELTAVLDWEEVDRVTRPFFEEKEVAGWETVFRKQQIRRGAPRDIADFRARITAYGLLHLDWRPKPSEEFQEIKKSAFRNLYLELSSMGVERPIEVFDLLERFNVNLDYSGGLRLTSREGSAALRQIYRQPDLFSRLVTPAGAPFQKNPVRLGIQLSESPEPGNGYEARYCFPDGTLPPEAVAVIDGRPVLYVTEAEIFEAGIEPGSGFHGAVTRIPAKALETTAGIAFLDRLGAAFPPRLESRVRRKKLSLLFRLWIHAGAFEESVACEVLAQSDGTSLARYWAGEWIFETRQTDGADGSITLWERKELAVAPSLIESLRLKQDHRNWTTPLNKNFPTRFREWLDSLPKGVEAELAGELASFKEGPVRGAVSLDIQASGSESGSGSGSNGTIDWFDVRVSLAVSEVTLTPEEIKLLLDSRGSWVRIAGKGWRRLEYTLTPEQEAQLADIGLTAAEFSAEPERLHALQLANHKMAGLIPAEHAQRIERRAAEIQTQVAPPVPKGITADLRSYQLAGFHFLAYLSTNGFGGVLADDMGLGKTLQTLTWLVWLREEALKKAGKKQKAPALPPSLVVCPKSVVDNWQAEAARFAPGLRVRILEKAGPLEASFAKAIDGADLVVINYAQLRLLDPELQKVHWLAAILDEAQAIKNPSSQTAHCASRISAQYRLALTGTPIENRLLDLWSILHFAMPGVLGSRAAFNRRFDNKGDPLARRRLAARVRPFLLRRTKAEVAKDLPERVEEDLHCEMEGPQETLYRAELKRARAVLLKVKTAKELDKERFNILTSLLRLRQICCHPALVSAPKGKQAAESAKLNALLDLLEPLMAEGNKVLVFSQFTGMLEIIRGAIAEREWNNFVLTGETENRGALVKAFQETDGAAVFLISLKAGGSGLNLTAASYVVLYDPWWNPAVENQAIDRTHRIGQKQTVFAYRLLVKESIEEKIRGLQVAKSAAAADILGEESFAKALTLADFKFLLEGE